MNLIQKNTEEVKFYTSLIDVSKWLEIGLEDYDWHLSDIDGGWLQDSGPVWITGRGLKSKIDSFDYQFIWAVISAYPLGTKPKLSNDPYAYDNPNFWTGIPSKQLDDSIFEIICWDSSATLFIGLSEEFGHRVLKNAPGIRDLDELNKNHK